MDLLDDTEPQKTNWNRIPEINDPKLIFPWPVEPGPGTAWPDNDILAVLFAFLQIRVPDVLWRLTKDPDRAVYSSGLLSLNKEQKRMLRERLGLAGTNKPTPHLADAIDRVNQIIDLVAPYRPFPNEARFKERADFNHFNEIWQKEWLESAVETQPFLQIKYFIGDFRDTGYAIENVPDREMDLWNLLLDLVDLPVAYEPMRQRQFMQSAVCSVCNIGSSVTSTLQQCPCSGARIYCGTSCQAKDWTPDHWALH